MKITLQREQLLKPLQMVIGAVDHKQAVPILSNVLLCINNNQLSVTGTDLEIELIGQESLTQQISNSALTLPARKLMDICKALPDFAPIELYQEKNCVVVKSERSRFTMSTMPADDFPSVGALEDHLVFQILQKDFSTILHQTAFAMAQQDVRYYLNGMLFAIEECRFKVVATDGHRLALNQIKIDVSPTQTTQVIVPYKAIMELMRLLKDSEQTIHVNISHHHIRITSNDFIFTSKLLEGRFPDYQRVIPKTGDKIITVHRDTLKQALLRTAVLCNEKARGVRFELQNNLLKLFSNNPKHEVAEEEIDVNYHGPQFEICFNINYLIDVLSVLRSESVRLTLIDTNHGVRIDDLDKNTNSIFVVMPMRI